MGLEFFIELILRNVGIRWLSVAVVLLVAGLYMSFMPVVILAFVSLGAGVYKCFSDPEL